MTAIPPLSADLNALSAAVHRLTLNQFLIAHLHFWRGLSLSEIAQQYGIPFKTVINLYNSALWNLRRLYQKQTSCTVGRNIDGYLHV